MKAIRIHEFGGPEVLKYEDCPDMVPGAGQVVINIQAVGVITPTYIPGREITASWDSGDTRGRGRRGGGRSW